MFFISIQISLKFVPKGTADIKISIGSANGLTQNKSQTITWSKTDPIH